MMKRTREERKTIDMFRKIAIFLSLQKIHIFGISSFFYKKLPVEWFGV